MFRAVPRQQLAAAFSAGLPLTPRTEERLSGALHQALEHPGSLMRAQFASEMGRAYSLTDDQVKCLGVAVEYFHTASLIFDDLPCMDDGAQRRGVACIHRDYGEATAILAALALVNRAYALLWRALTAAPAERRSMASDYVEKCLGIEGILNGQSQDLHYASLPPGERSPECVALGKTVSLIRLALVLPALLGRAKPAEIKMLERLASFWGLSYQILDDLKDVLQQPSQTGKTAARDAALSRPNLALAVGPKAAVRRLERLMRLGDCTLARLTACLPALVFLSDLSVRFREELAAIGLLA
jgi:geranylgeranyl pyrophosphate synthase